MLINARCCLFLLVPLLYTAAVSAQQHSPLTQPGADRIFLDVIVTPKSGPPVSGLQRQDFTLLDNKVPQTITSFQAVDGRQAPIEVILLVDAVNTGYQSLGYEREQIDKFLRADGGRLPHPTTIAVLTDTGTQIYQGFLTDGNVLSAWLDQYTVSLRTLRREDLFGAAGLFQLSLENLHELAAREAPGPGRKVILWVSPGWPLLSGPNVELDASEQQKLFGNIVDFSTQFLQARITLYSIDPLGTADAGFRTFYWKDFVKGISKPSQVQAGDLALEVLATQSGGLTLASSNNVSELLQRALADTGIYYELSFDPAPGDKANEYHSLEIHMAKPGLTARTRQGYYSQLRPR
jgi:VWFA-related protein